MASPAQKRFEKAFLPIADALASVDVEQTDRELIAEAVAEALDGRPDFQRDLFVLLATDPAVPCAGYDDADGEIVPCPEGRVIRLRWHWKDNPDGSGRSEEWKPRAPYGQIRCVSCGAKQFIPDYRENVLAREESQ